jgi:hypothetical protein
MWMMVERDTQTHKVGGARLVGPWARGEQP